MAGGGLGVFSHLPLREKVDLWGRPPKMDQTQVQQKVKKVSWCFLREALGVVLRRPLELRGGGGG